MESRQEEPFYGTVFIEGIPVVYLLVRMGTF